NRLTSMIEQIDQINDLNSIKFDTDKQLTEISIDHVISSTLKMFELEISNRNIKVEQHIEPCLVIAHEESIKQLVSNLINKANKHNYEQKPNKIKRQVTYNYYVISIGGTSGKITEEAQERLFDRYYRDDPSRNRQTGRTGLGLSIGQDIGEFHQGEIEVMNNEDYNQFIVKLPKSQPY